MKARIVFITTGGHEIHTPLREVTEEEVAGVREFVKKTFDKGHTGHYHIEKHLSWGVEIETIVDLSRVEAVRFVYEEDADA